MRFDTYKAGIPGAIVVAALCLSAAGCALTKGDFALRSSSTAPVAASAPLPAPVEVTPAVLVQNGATAPTAPTTVKSTNTANVDSLPPLPNGNAAAAPTAYAGTPATTNTKQLTPEEKARVVAELEALARGEPATPPAAAAKPDCTATATVKTGTAQAANACPPAPKPALRP